MNHGSWVNHLIRGYLRVLGLITLDARVQVRRDMMRENRRQNRQEADRATEPILKLRVAGRAAEDRGRWSAHPGRGHSRRRTQRPVTSPATFGTFSTPGPFFAPSRTPRQSHFRLPDRNPPLTPSVSWKRPVESRFPLVSALKRPTLRLRSKTQSPVHLLHSTRWDQVLRDP